jgi:hypothetical protein
MGEDLSFKDSQLLNCPANQFGQAQRRQFLIGKQGCAQFDHALKWSIDNKTL